MMGQQTATPSRVQASMSMWGYTLRWLIRRKSGSRSSSSSRFSALLEPGKDTLVLYSFMFPRWSGDTRPGPDGETGKLPLAETPCPSCTSILDSLDGAARHLSHRLNLAIVARSDPERIRTFA